MGSIKENETEVLNLEKLDLIKKINKPELLEPFTNYKIIEKDGVKSAILNFGTFQPNKTFKCGEIKLNVSIPMFFPPETYKQPTVELMEENLIWVYDWMENQGLMKEVEKNILLKILAFCRDVFVITYHLEVRNIHSGIEREMVLMAALMFIADDISEDLDLFTSQEVKFDEAFSNFEKYLEVWDYERLKAEASNFYPALRPLLLATIELLKQAQEKDIDGFKNMQSTRTLMSTYMRGFFQANQLLSKADEDEEPLPESMFRCLKDVCASPRGMQELIITLPKADVSDRVKKHVLYPYLVNIGEKLSTLLNDLIGLKRDLTTEHAPQNLVIYKHRVCGMSIEDAAAYVNQEVQQLAKDFEFTVERLLEIFEDEAENLNYTIALGRRSCDVVGYLNVYARRYGDLRKYFGDHE